MVAAFIDSSENMTLGYSPLQNAAAPASRSKSASAAATAQNASEGQNAPETEKPHRGLFGPEGFTFAAFLDIINPLQHIPVVNSIYRAVTGDTIENGSRIIGGALFGGPIGLVASVINGIVDEETGKDIGSHALAAIGIDDGMGRDPSVGLAQKAPDTATETALAQAQNAPQYQQLAQNAPQDMARQNGPQQRLPQNGAQDEPALGALAALTARSWGEAQQTAAEAPAAAARDGGIPFNQITASQAPGSLAAANRAAANNGRDARGDERQWFSTQTNQGGVVQRSVGAQPVTAASVSQKFGVARGMAHASAAAPRPGPQPAPENLPQQLPNIPQVPADFAERANAAYQKYIDMKQTDGSRRAVDQSF